MNLLYDESNVVASNGTSTNILHRHVLKDGDWVKEGAQPHPAVELTLNISKEDYEGFGLSFPMINEHNIHAIVDSGAQCCLWGLKNFHDAGFKLHHLIPFRQNLYTVSKACIQISGACLLRLGGVSKDGKAYNCGVLAYVSPDVPWFYLSREAMIQLEIVPPHFPTVGNAALNFDALTSEQSEPPTICQCPKRSLPPGLPDKLLFLCCPDNVDKIKSWLLDQYSSSTFNTCPHQLLPEMDGPPVCSNDQATAKASTSMAAYLCSACWRNLEPHRVMSQPSSQQPGNSLAQSQCFWER